MSSASEKKPSVVVGEQFLAPHDDTAFTVTKVYSPAGPSFSVGGAAVMKVETPIKGYCGLRSISCLDAATSQPVMALKEIGMGRGRWEAFSGDGASGGQGLFAAVLKSWFFLKGTQIEVFLGTGNSSDDEQKLAAGSVVVDSKNSSVKTKKTPDYVVHGNFYRGELTVSRGCGCRGGGDDVARIQRTSSLWKFDVQGGESAYDVKVNKDEDQAFVLALTVILDQMFHYDRDVRYYRQ